MAGRNRAAVSLGKMRMDKMNLHQRQEFSRLGLSARWAPPTKQDKRISGTVKATFATAIYAAVDALFDWFSRGGGRRALIVHQGVAWVVDPETKDFRIQQQRFPDSVVGVYNAKAERGQVIDDISENCKRLGDR